MQELFDLKQFDSYREGNRREVKKAQGGLPVSLWESYSAFANTNGGVIILGVSEQSDGSWQPTGLPVKGKNKLIKDFWDTINNRKKVSINLLKDEDVQTYSVNENAIIVISVPAAKREDRPVFVNDNLLGGSFRRNGEGDYHCTRSEVKAMLRDATEETSDMKVVERFDLSVIDRESMYAYRNRHKSWKPGHVFEAYSDEEYLRAIGGAAELKARDGSAAIQFR